MTRDGIEVSGDPTCPQGHCPVNGTGLTGGVGLVNGTGLTNATAPPTTDLPGPDAVARVRGFTNGGGRAVAPPLSVPTDQINGLVHTPAARGAGRRGTRALPWAWRRSRRRLEKLALMPLLAMDDVPTDGIVP